MLETSRTADPQALYHRITSDLAKYQVKQEDLFCQQEGHNEVGFQRFQAMGWPLAPSVCEAFGRDPVQVDLVTKPHEKILDSMNAWNLFVVMVVVLTCIELFDGDVLHLGLV